MSKFLHNLKDKVQNVLFSWFVTDDLQQDAKGWKQHAVYAWNPNHRHDEPHEIEMDNKRQAVRDSHRFNSFAPIRTGNNAKWFLQGHDYFHALSEIIDSAKESIFILDWWLSPELYLRRPPYDNEQWRVDRLLKRKAEQGVKIYISVFKEVTQALTISSAHTKHFLERLHPNIAVIRHPDHIGGESTEMWSHHEKLVVIDNSVACVGGLDICFGRWDTYNCPLVDAPIQDLSLSLFPGQDMNDNRVADFVKIDEWLSRQLDRLNLPRMPWNDVHSMISGPVVLDLAQHFIERWNFIRSLKYTHDDRYPKLAFPHNLEGDSADKSISEHPHFNEFKEGLRHALHSHNVPTGVPEGDIRPKGGMDIQLCRSSADWSHGILKEDSIQRAYIQLIREASHFIYIENQFFVSSPGKDCNKPVENKIAEAIVERVLSAAKDGKSFKVYINIPAIPGFVGDIKGAEGILAILYARDHTIARGDGSICGRIRAAGFDPAEYIFVGNLRSYDRMPPPALVRAMEERSGYKWEDVQAALARVWVGDHADPDEEKKVQKIEIQEAARGEALKQDEQQKDKVQKMTTVPKTTKEALDIIEKWENSCPTDAPKIQPSISHLCMDTPEKVKDQPWYGSEKEEVASYVTEIAYIHSKLLIVDDRTVLIGSANVNERSQLGNRDSEIAIVINDSNLVESRMDGAKHMATQFASSLRRHIFKLHLGLLPPQPCTHESKVGNAARPLGVPQESSPETDHLVEDPVAPEFWQLWRGTARKNLQHFQNVFHCVPSSEVHTWEDYDRYVPKPPTLVGHVHDPEMSLDYVRAELDGIKGRLVEYPLEFLNQENMMDKARGFSVNFATLPVYI